MWLHAAAGPIFKPMASTFNYRAELGVAHHSEPIQAIECPAMSLNATFFQSKTRGFQPVEITIPTPIALTTDEAVENLRQSVIAYHDNPNDQTLERWMRCKADAETAYGINK